MKKFYKELGWNLMLNKSGKIGKGADSIVLLGVENWGAAKRFQKYGDIEKAMQGVNKAGFSILLSHDPSYWDSITSHTHPEIALTLSGHTHGGQIGIETGRVKWSILSASNPFWGGLYTRQTGSYLSTLYVNRGLGTVGYAGRVGIKPEITLIILHHEN
jgi:predicted MPP superfamily phosphohydrolase